MARNPEENHQKFAEKMQNSTKKLKKIGNSIIQLRKNVDDFWLKFEIEERCKGVHCVDLGESFPTSIYLQKSASIQPRTSPSKFGEKFSSLFTSLLNLWGRARASSNFVADLPGHVGWMEFLISHHCLHSQKVAGVFGDERRGHFR